MNSTHEQSGINYEIKVQGELDRNWESYFTGFEIMPVPTGETLTTTLTGPVSDQSALRGLLCKLWDLNLTLISVRQLGSYSKKGARI